MSTFDNTNRGAIFKNENRTNENQPSYRGKINVDGVDKEISLWIKESKDGKKFFSASISEPYVKEGEATDKRSIKQIVNEKNDDLPF